MSSSDNILQAEAQSPASLAALPDEALLDAVQRQTFRFFWEGSHPLSGLAPDRRTTREEPVDDLVAIGGSGFGVMALIVAVERGWVTREAAVERLQRMLEVLVRATCYHGAFPHFMNGRTGATIPFYRKDDGGDLVETSFLCMGLLCARQYFQRDTPGENFVRDKITVLWGEVEWDWYTQGGRKLLYWHWSPNNGWAMDHEIHGWNECLITYVLAASARAMPSIPPSTIAASPPGATSSTASPTTASSCRWACLMAARCFSLTTPSAASTRAA